MNNSYFSKKVKQLSAIVFLLLFVTAVKAQSPVTISNTSTVNQTIANTIQGYLNNGQDVILTSTYDITISNGVSILKSAGGNASLTFKANHSVTMDVDTSIKSTAGKLNLIFWSNATNDSGTKGMIRFGDYQQPVANVLIESNGGHLWMGGGNADTSWNGLTVGNGYAWGSSSPSNTGWYGIEMYGDTRFFTTGGNVSLNGRSTDSGQNQTFAVYLVRSIINAGSGNIDINTLTDGTSFSNGETTGIAIIDDGGFTTTTGNITINNTISVQGNTSGTATGIYLERSDNGNPVITSNQGNVSIVTNFSGAAASTKWYIDINEINFNREKSLTGVSFTELIPNILSGGSSTFSSSNTSAATVNNSGLISPVGVGITNITGIFARNDWSSINSRWRYKLYILSQADPVLSFSQAEVYKNINDSSFTLTASQLNQSGTVGAITYASSNRSVATVNSSTGAVTIVGEGSTVINATSARTVTYVQEGNAIYTLYVVNGFVVFTSAVNTSSAGVTVSGNVVSDGGNAVTERGFVYSLTSSPTTSNTKVVSGNGLGTFAESVTGLTPITTYYVRSYAINSSGTSYGSQLSFITKANSIPVISPVGNAVIVEGTTPSPISFTVNDLETLLGNLTVTASSSNTTLIPNENIVLLGNTGSRTITVTPVSGEFGSSIITINLNDNSGGVVTEIFAVTIDPLVINKNGQFVSDASQAIDKYGAAGSGKGRSKYGKIRNKPLSLQIGNAYQGGKIAYILVSGDPGYDANVQHGLIVSTTDQSTGIKWNNGANTTTGALATALATGLANTNTIIVSQGASATNYAAGLARAYTITDNGVTYNDWYLPSKDELYKIYLNKVAIGNFSATYYWSSTENEGSTALIQDFNSGNSANIDKSFTHYVRAVRSF
jgi:hypothetical protein